MVSFSDVSVRDSHAGDKTGTAKKAPRLLSIGCKS